MPRRRRPEASGVTQGGIEWLLSRRLDPQKAPVVRAFSPRRRPGYPSWGRRGLMPTRHNPW
ncbi:hypothetical protein FRAHR75_110100 [Frankia sp. Hr75.2]|nr:hypothetical protein FRAHR75_110100 [Frankia sp. Hr75.2]SQD93947.1 hypothetical protein FMEAI12_2120007 [Parafrankia sp. Ea1.12]